METTASPPLAAEAIGELVRRRAAATPQAPLLVDEDRRRFTAGQFGDLVSSYAETLRRAGVRAGDVVSWQLPNTVEAMALSMALAQLAAVQNPLIMMLRAEEVAHITGRLHSRLLIVTEVFAAEAFAAALGSEEQAPAIHVLSADPAGGALPALPPRPPADFGAEVRWIFYTSGTTGVPKGVKHTDRTLLAAADTFIANVGPRPEDRCAALAPFAHIGGVAHLLHALIIGHVLVVGARKFVPERLADLLIDEEVTLVGSGLPFTNEYLRIARERGVAPLFPKSRATLAGGSPRPRDQHEQARELLGGVGVISGYGMTECPYITWGSPSDTDEQHAVAEGRPGPGGSVRIVRADETAAAVGEIGEIRVRGPQLFCGYVDSTRDAEALDADGYFRTGDLGYLDSDGCLAVTGRLKDIIVRKMENIPAREVEEALIADPAIADVCVIGLPDTGSGERVCAVVVPRDASAPPTLESVRVFLSGTSLNKRKYPEQVEIVTELPRNSLGKIAKPALRERFSDTMPASDTRPATAATPGNRQTPQGAVAESFTTIEFEVSGHVATVTLNRPHRLNSFDQVMAEEMARVWQRVRDDDGIRVAILQANGERAFCTGIDLEGGAWWKHKSRWNQEDPGVSLGPRQHRVWKPVICAVHGMAAGGAMYFINECDIVICSSEATFFDPHANGGMVSALEPIGMLARGIPLGEVLRWALLGSDERMTAETALRSGIVTEIVETGHLRSRARQLAEEIAARRPEAIQGTVRAIWEALEMNPSIALRNGLSYTQIGNPGDGRTDSRVNKRTPRLR
ncbi:AMP-binding protein [Nocardia nova]|jgi:acyl-CoA synthetase (AMP-forming)/AMP-acid ligase II/enoyl-CoA hydratase/carnithine racemase|uniref:Fatty-acid--CoA ligase n=2 Tax=Nocardia nova TaxID=37330 RepID=A0A2S6A6C9_9NOCA|nr:AMP-binding protein [Nocardia nova]PPI94060.1 fatty-acid--CoA ligase [Nocardia nova]PPJ11972.1 fatty-acid--CoA ligase [Nocardia nova]PPJ28134.1 fatty-acid--CoA ligase [Nocardia nova]